MTDASIEVAAFDRVSPEAAAVLLAPVCASGAWIDAVVAGRPYGSFERVVTRSDEAMAALTWPSVEQALAAHPRIGDRAEGADRESAWSRDEQSAAGGPSEALRQANVEYEHQFGQVFLICASGRSAEQILAALTERLANDPPTEQDVVRHELAAIAKLRLAKVLS